MKKIFSILIIALCLGVLTISQSSAEVGGETTRSIDTTNMNVCTMEYAPVCAQPPMPECPEGMSCIQVMPPLKTYGNSCMAEADGAEIQSQGTCESTTPVSNGEDVRICTMEYAPVCGVDGVTYGNACGAGDTEIAYKSECESMVNVTRMKLLTERFESRYTPIVAEISYEVRAKAIEAIDQRIKMVKLSRIATWVQEQQITDLMFLRNIFVHTPYNG